ncbi:2OG-Fe(II) oxygenase [Streptomyces lunaelactis]|uniref:2OG-Fe(II) oxygenase n=1 Tax=Streptomyces lunaelactis TaxID=1535768 RepID=UPI0015858BFC|nr:2OG-Fe(II) oxygenase [Streptomyces lunaelactis]NUK32268.1 2OG-Fe(II) oxygenase [Streptomyces lunaelactis]
MIHIAETLIIGSIEGFLIPDEIRELTAVMDTAVVGDAIRRFDTERATTLHTIPGHTLKQAMAVYEPAGRLEIHPPPQDAATILATAVERAMPALRRALPALTRCREWMYVEYGPGQHITPHIDGVAPDPSAWPRQIAGISVVLEHAEAGGEFFVETISDAGLWNDEGAGGDYSPSMAFTHDGADYSADWFRTMPRTRWTVAPQPGTALLYGSQLTHGTEPVRQGRERKFISWLISES